MSRHSPSRHFTVLVLSVFALCLLAFTATGQIESESADATPEAAPAADSAQVERGRYLVTGVSMCGECHTPRDASGDLQMHLWLKGAPVPVATPQGFEPWVHRAPRIAGLPQHTDEEFVTLMTTGINRDGVDQWRPYDAWLDPLKSALGPVLEAYPGVPPLAD